MPQTKLLDDKIKPKRSGRKKAKIQIREISKEDMKSILEGWPGPFCVGLDTHKRTIQVSVMTPDGTEISNGSIPNTEEAVRKSIGSLPKDCKLVMESSSVWKAPFFQIRDDLGMDIVLSNPRLNKVIAESKRKTDKVDARILADLHRCNYIITCHVPSKIAMANRDLTRHRHGLAEQATVAKNRIQGILLQERINLKNSPFTSMWKAQARALGDYRINAQLRIIDSIDDEIIKAELRIRDAVRKDDDALLLTSIPGVGNYTALAVSAEIDGIGRFVRPEKLSAYVGVVPSVRSSADKAIYGSITKTGSDMVRHLLVEAAHSHVRYAEDSDITEFYNRIMKKRGRGRAAVATASRILRVIWHMLQERREFVHRSSQRQDHGMRFGESLQG